MQLKVHMATVGFTMETEDPFGDYTAFGPVVRAFEAAGFRAKGIQNAPKVVPQSSRRRSPSAGSALVRPKFSDGGSGDNVAKRLLSQTGRRGSQFSSMGVGLQQAVLRFHESHPLTRPPLQRTQKVTDVAAQVHDKGSTSVSADDSEVLILRAALDRLRAEAETSQAEVAHSEQKLELLTRTCDQLERERTEVSVDKYCVLVRVYRCS
jgi:hypothetical protein